mmetsp:Transcript_12952/g.28384  ORF Transcript_12952/g.28384 Transcript_12952/m.28384 type:complete len:241 (-) Transcript_12952:711-1433(-)
MRIMIRRVPRIRKHRTQVLQMNLTQATLQTLTHPKFDREFICFKLTPTRVHRHCKTQSFVNGSPNGGEEEEKCDQGGNGTTLIVESKSSVEFMRVVAQCKGVETSTSVELSDDKVDEGVAHLPVPEFMPQDCQDFIVVNLFNEGIIENNSLILEESKHVSIRVTTPLTPIHNKQLCQRKLQLPSQLKDLFLQLAFGERFVLVKPWHDQDWNDSHHEHGEHKGECPDIDVEVISTRLDNLQ